MGTKRQLQHNDEGFVLVVTLLIMVVLSIIGIAMNRNTTIELQIAGNDKVHKQSFTEADGGTEFAAEILELNISCLEFASGGAESVLITDPEDSGDNNALQLDGLIGIDSASLKLWQNGVGHWSTAGVTYPADDQRDMWFPPTYLPGEPHTNMTVEGEANFAEGSSIILAAGYLGLGRGMGSGGIVMNYEVHSQHLGQRDSESVIRVQWRHVVGNEDTDCNYN